MQMLRGCLLSFLLCIGANAQTSTLEVGSPKISSVKEFAAKGDGVTDDTEAFQAALDSRDLIFVPAGIYLIDPTRGLKLRSNQTVIGEGNGTSLLLAKPMTGSVFRRYPWTTDRPRYVHNVVIQDIGVLLQHPAGMIDVVQIAFDFRNISRSKLIRIYAGNLPWGSQQTLSRPENVRKGYGVVFGSVASGSREYAGGELNQLLSSHIWGAKKCVVLDDISLSPDSASHGAVVRDNDIQFCESGIAQESSYTAGVLISGNTLQAIRRAEGSADQSFGYRIEGYSNQIVGAYFESEPPDYILRLGEKSHGNRVELGYFDTTELPRAVYDLGQANSLSYYSQDGQMQGREQGISRRETPSTCGSHAALTWQEILERAIASRSQRLRN